MWGLLHATIQSDSQKMQFNSRNNTTMTLLVSPRILLGHRCSCLYCVIGIGAIMIHVLLILSFTAYRVSLTPNSIFSLCSIITKQNSLLASTTLPKNNQILQITLLHYKWIIIHNQRLMGIADIARIHMVVLASLSIGLLMSISWFEKAWNDVQSSRGESSSSAAVNTAGKEPEKTD